MSNTQYRCRTRNLEAFIQYIGVQLVPRGYHYYATSWIPERIESGAAFHAVDAKLISKYNVDIGRAERARKERAARRQGRRLARVRYFRCNCSECDGRCHVLFATSGRHKFFQEERFRNIKYSPFVHAGYCVRRVNSRVTAEWERSVYLEQRALFLDMAKHRKAEAIERALWNIGADPINRFGGVAHQLKGIRLEVNALRKESGFKRVSADCIREGRRNVTVFDDDLGGLE